LISIVKKFMHTPSYTRKSLECQLRADSVTFAEFYQRWMATRSLSSWSKNPKIAALVCLAKSSLRGIVAWIVIARSIYEVDDVAISKFLEECHKNLTPRIRDCFARARNDDPGEQCLHAMTKYLALILELEVIGI
jgi:hypothetical protein